MLFQIFLEASNDYYIQAIISSPHRLKGGVDLSLVGGTQNLKARTFIIIGKSDADFQKEVHETNIIYEYRCSDHMLFYFTND